MGFFLQMWVKEMEYFTAFFTKKPKPYYSEPRNAHRCMVMDEKMNQNNACTQKKNIDKQTYVKRWNQGSQREPKVPLRIALSETKRGYKNCK